MRKKYCTETDKILKMSVLDFVAAMKKSLQNFCAKTSCSSETIGTMV